MADIDGDKLCFIVEWFDPMAQITRRYYLNFYVHSKSTEMIEVKTRKMFLKKSKVENVGLEDMYVGSTIHIFGRPLTIMEFADEYTTKKLASKKEKTLAIIKPDAVKKMGEILTCISEKGFLVTKMRMCRLDRREASRFYAEHIGKSFFEALVSFMSTGPVLAMELMASNAVQYWRDVIGPTDPADARNESVTLLRSRYGTDKTCNAVHGSDSIAAAARETEFFFPTQGDKLENTVKFDNATLCVVKPHAVAHGLTGPIIEMIQANGFCVSMLGMYHMEKANVEEFLEVYRGVVYEYGSMVVQMCMGPCVAIEVRRTDCKETALSFREFTGPADPEIARTLRPHTLRAKFGVDKIKNAIHCTDLPEDAELELQYFFKILDKL